MTAKEIIEAALLRVEDVDSYGRISVLLLSRLRSFAKVLYDFAMVYKLTGMPGFEITGLNLATLDSEGRYALPSDHYRTVRVWKDGSGMPARPVSYDWLVNVSPLNRTSTYDGSGTDYLYYAISNGYWHFRPTGSTNVNVYYYPSLASIDLTDDMPGGGILDEPAIDFLVDSMYKDDRFNTYDVGFSNLQKNNSILRAKAQMLNYCVRFRSVWNPIHSYNRLKIAPRNRVR
jgi:hypothetical protein